MKSYLMIATFAFSSLFSVMAAAENEQPNAEQQMLQRIYQLRMRFEQERIQRENEARANVQLASQVGGQVDNPTVSGLRQWTNAQLARFEQQFRCLDVDLQATTGNTVVICGDNSGDISGSNVSANRDIVTLQGGQP